MLPHSKPIGLSEIKALPSVPFSDRKSFPDSKGVYFVVDGDEIVYIGMTAASFRDRWAGHHRLQDIEESCKAPMVFFLSVRLPSDRILDVERSLILAHSPRMNKSASLKKSHADIRLTSEDVSSLEKQFESITKEQLASIGIALCVWEFSSIKEKIMHIVGAGMLKIEAMQRSATQC
jgi:hypothetical protein